MKVLVVEDDVMLADFTEEALQDLGHCVCAITGRVEEAVRLVREHRPDLVVLDMQLQDSEYGTDIANRLAATNDLGCMGILYISGEIDRVRNKARFGHACLGKPHSIATLAQALVIAQQIANGTPWTHPAPHGIELLTRQTAAVS